MQIGPYTLDGYNQETNTTYELYGYPSCHPELETETHPHRVDRTYGALYEETLRREHHSREQRYEMVIIWEQDFVQTLNFQDLFNPWEALKRGITNATRLYCIEGAIRYVSVFPILIRPEEQTFQMGQPEFITDPMMIKVILVSLSVGSYPFEGFITLCFRNALDGNCCFPYVEHVPRNTLRIPTTAVSIQIRNTF